MMNQIRSFLMNPSFSGGFKKPSSGDILTYFLFYILLVLPFGILLFFFSMVLDISSKEIQLSNFERIFYGIFLTPIIEEVLFRLIYVFNKRNIYIILFTVFALLALSILKHDVSKSMIFVGLILLLILILFFFKGSASIFQKHFKFFFYFIAIIFALLHVFNFYAASGPQLFLLIFFTIPQFILGVLLGYLRIKYGFIYAVVFHFMVNLSLLF